MLQPRLAEKFGYVDCINCVQASNHRKFCSSFHSELSINWKIDLYLFLPILRWVGQVNNNHIWSCWCQNPVTRQYQYLSVIRLIALDLSVTFNPKQTACFELQREPISISLKTVMKRRSQLDFGSLKCAKHIWKNKSRPIDSSALHEKY